MAKWVWAIDENGKPCKCTAKPENRGKGRCHHMFHAEPGENANDFLKKFGYKKDETEKEFSDRVLVEDPDITMEDLPQYDEMIKGIINQTDTSEFQVADKVVEMINGKNFKNQKMFEGCEVEVEQGGIDPDDPTRMIVYMTFTDADGKVYERSFSYPASNELNQYEINGSLYRYIPTINKRKTGVSSGIGGVVYFNDEDNKSLLRYIKEDGTYSLRYENPDNPGRYKTTTGIPANEIEGYLNGEDTNLTSEQKAALSRLHPIAKERISNEGFDALKQLPPDDMNDLEYRGVATYADRLSYTIFKNLNSMDSLRKKNVKAGRPYEFTMDNMGRQIDKDLVGASYMQVADDINPIASMSQSQKLSWVGEGDMSWGNRDRISTGLRGVHPSYRGIVDPNDVSLGGKIGVTVAIRGSIDENGMIKKSKGEVLTGSDFIPYAEHSDPQRSAMAIAQMKEACPLIGGEDPILSTKGWDKIKGAKLGRNLTVAYLPMAETWEDATAISESAAKSMATVQTKKYQINGMPPGLKPGMEIPAGGKIGTTDIRYPGKVKEINGNNVVIETVYPLGVGDKVSARYGNKGVISRVIPDDQMPIVDGKRADIICSPIGVAGRSNLGQIYEVNGGDFDKKSTIEYNGHVTQGTGGTMFFMRINQIAEKKLLKNSDRMSQDKRYKARFGEMESILLSTNEDRLAILNYLKHQEYSDSENRLMNTLHGLGIDIVPRGSNDRFKPSSSGLELLTGDGEPEGYGCDDED